MSQDSCVRFLADKNLKQQLSLKRKRFRPVEVARDALTIRPGASRKTLVKSAKGMVSEEVNTSTLESLHSLERQGQMSRCASPRGAAAWATAVQSLPEEPMKFALNAAVDVLPHNANLYLWRKRKDTTCPLCGANQSLLHVLNNCTVARNARRYNFRHDAVLKVIASVITPNIPQTTTITVDIGEGYSFPLHIVETDLRPDLVWWDETDRSLHMVELTVPFESNFVEAAERKSAKYTDLVERARANGYQTSLLTLQVGSRGVPDLPAFEKLFTTLHLPSKEQSQILIDITREVLLGSFGI